MSKTLLGLLFILAGLLFGSLAIDAVYNGTLGWLVEHDWIKLPPLPAKGDLKAVLGRKAAILVYAGVLVIIGLFILWNRNA